MKFPSVRVADGQSWKTLKGYPTIYRIFHHMKVRMLIIFLANFGGSSLLRKKKKTCAQQPVFSQRPSAYIIWIKKKKKGELPHLQKRLCQPQAKGTRSIFFLKDSIIPSYLRRYQKVGFRNLLYMKGNADLLTPKPNRSFSLILIRAYLVCNKTNLKVYIIHICLYNTYIYIYFEDVIEET